MLKLLKKNKKNRKSLLIDLMLNVYQLLQLQKKLKLLKKNLFPEKKKRQHDFKYALYLKKPKFVLIIYTICVGIRNMHHLLSL